MDQFQQLGTDINNVKRMVGQIINLLNGFANGTYCGATQAQNQENVAEENENAEEGLPVLNVGLFRLDRNQNQGKKKGSKKKK